MQREYDELSALLDVTELGEHRSMPSNRLELRLASEIEPEPISWLWQEWLAAGKLHILGGQPSTGKTTLALSFAATVSQGGRWPDGTEMGNHGNVLVWSGEDDAADTLVPRLSAMGADLSRIRIVSNANGRRPFDPATDMPALIEEARIVGNVRLLILDPVVTAVAGDSNKNAEVRRALAPLVTFAQELDSAVLGITHFSKGTEGRHPLARVTGSLAFGAAPRIVFAASKMTGTEDVGGSHVFMRLKSNIGPDDGALVYALERTPLRNGIVTSRVQWGRFMTGNARDILALAEGTDQQPGEASALDDAKEFLREFLRQGPSPSVSLLQEAKKAGVTVKTLYRAKRALGITSNKCGMSGGWLWALPKTVLLHEDGPTPEVANFENGDHLGDVTETSDVREDQPTDGSCDASLDGTEVAIEELRRPRAPSRQLAAHVPAGGGDVGSDS